MNKLKYINYYIGYQEVPNEISLCINISGCPYKCEGCHSKYLWEDTGNYVTDDLDKLLKKYDGMITCVCFMGGDQNLVELSALLSKVRDEYKIKTCVYSGNDNKNMLNNILSHIDYLKIGRYNRNLGGLSSKTTNQIFYKIHNSKLTNITSKFQTKS